MTIHSTFWYLLGPVLRASQLFSYLTSNYSLPGGEDALTVDRGGKEDRSHGQEGAKLRLAHLTPGPYSEAQAICPTVSRPCAECFLLELTVNQEDGWIHGKSKGCG